MEKLKQREEHFRMAHDKRNMLLQQKQDELRRGQILKIEEKKKTRGQREANEGTSENHVKAETEQSLGEGAKTKLAEELREAIAAKERLDLKIRAEQRQQFGAKTQESFRSSKEKRVVVRKHDSERSDIKYGDRKAAKQVQDDKKVKKKQIKKKELSRRKSLSMQKAEEHLKVVKVHQQQKKREKAIGHHAEEDGTPGEGLRIA